MDMLRMRVTRGNGGREVRNMFMRPYSSVQFIIIREKEEPVRKGTSGRTVQVEEVPWD